jgi:hypothetical protein
VKQIAMAMMMYVDDNNSSYPSRMPDPEAGAPYPCKPCRTIDWRPFVTNYLSTTTNITNGATVFVCPGDKGIPEAIAADPFNQVTPRPRRFAFFYGSSYCFNTVMTRLGKEGAVAIRLRRSRARIWSWHQPLAIQDFQGKTRKPIRGLFL